MRKASITVLLGTAFCCPWPSAQAIPAAAPQNPSALARVGGADVQPDAASGRPAGVADAVAARPGGVDRVQELEAQVARLRKEAASSDHAIAELQARLRRADYERYANPIVFALSSLLVLLGAVVAGLWYLLRRRDAPVRQATAPATEPGASTTRPAAVASGHRPASSLTVPPEEGEPAGEEAPEAAARRASPEGKRPSRSGAERKAGAKVADAGDAAAEPPPHERFDRSMSERPSRTVEPAPPPRPAEPDPVAPGVEPALEEWIDLEQQAEFFVVLGDDRTAINLLEAHLLDSGAGNPLPYLKLLEIHQRRQDQAGYDQLREVFNARFNAAAPAWSNDPHEGRSLEDHPDTMAALTTAWPDRTSALRLLNDLLFKPDAGAETFDFPAYRELLLLHSVARDLAGPLPPPVVMEVDLLLPLEDVDQPTSVSPTTLTPGADTVRDANATTVDIDLDNWPGVEAGGAQASTAHHRRTAGEPA